MDDVALKAALFKNQHRAFPVIHETGEAIDAVAEILQQMAQAAGKTPLDISRRDIVPAVCDPLGHAQFRHFDAGQGQVEQFGPPTVALHSFDQLWLGTARQGGFKDKVLTLRDALLDLAQKNPTGRQQLPLRGQRRKTVRDQVRIDEMGAARHVGQVLQGEGGFARAIGRQR